MSLKIIMEPINNTPPFVNIGQNVKIIDIESGVDISKCVRNMVINIFHDDWVGAILECDIGKLELIGVDIKDIIPIRNDIKQEELDSLTSKQGGIKSGN